MSSLVVIPFALIAASLVKAVPVGPSTVPSYNGWTSVGCFVDDVNNRQLPHPEATVGGTAGMTVERCLDACHADGYTFAGLEWSQECYCGNTVPPQAATDGRCDMACNGNSAEICGGGNGLSVYQYPTTPTGPSPVQSYGDWSFTGCYVDSISARVLPEEQFPAGSLTVEKCLDACDALGYEYAGVEYGQECYCGRTAPTTLATDGRCDMPCAGNSQEACGGGNGIDVYKTCNSANAPSSPPWYNGWDYSGCYVDSVDNRVLPLRTDIDEDPTMTVEKCLTACGQQGYYWAGIEYSQECYCGTSVPPQLATDGRCNMVCNGNSLELCGGPNGIDVYQWTNSQNPGPGNQGGGCAVTSTFTTETSVASTTTLTTTITEETPGFTTITDPYTVATTIPVTVTGSTTVAVPITGSTTVPVPATGSFTTDVPIITLIPTTEVATVTSVPIVTVTRTSYTLSIFTGTTSFADPYTTIYEPVIILTTLAKTFATLTPGAPTLIPSTTIAEVPYSTSVASIEPFTTTTGDIEPVTSTSYEIEPIISTSFDIEPVTTTSYDVEAATGTYVTTFTTTITTDVPTPVTVTTVITAAPANTSTSAP